MKDINLFEGLHFEKNEYRRERTKNKIMIGLVLLTLLGSASTIAYYEIGARLLDNETNQITLDMATYDEIIAMKDKINNMEIRTSAYRLLEQTGRSYLDTEVLGMLANNFPEGVSTGNMSFDRSGSISMSGAATSIDDVAYLISRLKRDERVKTVFVSNVTVNSIEDLANETGDTALTTENVRKQNVAFTITIALK